MRVLQINAVYGTGSTGIIMENIHQQILNSGFESFVAYSLYKQTAEGIHNGYQIGKSFGKKMHALLSRFSGLQGYFSRHATKKLLKYMDEIRPDIIHLHNLHNNFINLKLLMEYIKERQITTVITLHDCWFLTGKCSHFLYDDCEKWKTGCGKCPRFKKDNPSWFFDRTKKLYRDKKRWIADNPYIHVIGCSKWITQVAKDSILKERVAGTIYNGIDLNIFKPTENDLRKKLAIGDKFIILGFAGKWLSVDNQETYQYMIEHLDDHSMLVLLGCRKEDIPTLPKNVVGLPFITDKTLLAQVYSMADVFVNVTKADTLPTVNMEALACGTPVITYDSGGSAELVNEKIGAIVPYGEVASLMGEIQNMRKLKKGNYIEACIDYAKQHFEKESCYAKYIELYVSLSARN